MYFFYNLPATVAVKTKLRIRFPSWWSPGIPKKIALMRKTLQIYPTLSNHISLTNLQTPEVLSFLTA